MAFVSERDGVTGVWRIDHGREERVSAENVGAFAPAWGRCGNQLAFVARDPRSSRFEVFLTGNGAPRSLFQSDGAISDVALGPDGRRLYFVQAEPPGQRLVEIELSTGKARVVFERPEADLGQIAVHPQSGRLTVAGLGPDGKGILHTLDPRRGTFDEEGTLAGFSPAWSPDGRALAFVREVAGGWSLVVRRDAHSETVLESPRLIYNPAWTPDGARLLYERYEEETPDIWSLDIVGGDAERLVEGTGFDGAPAPRPAC